MDINFDNIPLITVKDLTTVNEAFLATGTSDEVPKKRYVLSPAKPAKPIPANAGVINASAVGNHQVGNNYMSSSVGGRNKIDTATILASKKKKKELESKLTKLASEAFLPPALQAQLDWALSFKQCLRENLD